MKVQTFLCIGGPCNGLEVTEQYAGPDYVRYNRSQAHRIVRPPRKGHRSVPKCILVFLPWLTGKIEI